jgi:hypothetical protein
VRADVLRNQIDAARMSGMTAGKTFERQPASAQQAKALDGL